MTRTSRIETSDPGSACRALAVIAPRADRSSARGLAGFLTQLMACARRLPAYARARRVEPSLALPAYSPRRAARPQVLDMSV